MSTATLKELTEKLQYAPPSIIERILGYADALLENSKEQGFVLTEAQKKHLIKQNEVALDQCNEAEQVYNKLKKKHGL